MSDYDFILELQLSFCDAIAPRIDEIIQEIINLEKLNNVDEIQTSIRHLLGEFHSIKGSSSAIQFKTIQSLCHKVEDIIIENKDLNLKNQIENLLKYCDVITEYALTFKQKRYVDDALFLSKHRSVFEKVQPPKNSKAEKRSITIKVLAVGIPLTIINNLKKYNLDIKLDIAYSNSSADALSRFSIENFDLVISSYFIDPIDGISFCIALKNQWKDKKFKFILLPSQELNGNLFPQDTRLLPDQIIIKDQKMYQLFSEFCLSLFRSEIKKILFIDDDPTILEIYKSILEDAVSCETYFISPSGDLVDNINKISPDLIVSDVNMPLVNIDELFADISLATNKKTKFIFITGDADTPLCQDLFKNGALAIFEKSSIINDLVDHLATFGVPVKKS